MDSLQSEKDGIDILYRVLSHEPTEELYRLKDTGPCLHAWIAQKILKERESTPTH